MLVSGPISVAGSSGLPTRMDCASAVKRSRNASAVRSCSTSRAPAMQAWPWLWKIAQAEPFLAAAVNGSAWAIFHNQGQACIAGARLVLHERTADAFLDRFTALAQSIRVGNPLDPATEMGPLTSMQHRDRVLGYVAIAREQGGSVVSGGKAPDAPEFARGCYVEPTVVKARTWRDRV